MFIKRYLLAVKRGYFIFIRKDVLKLAVPIIIEQTFIMVLGTYNTMMTGNSGEEAISAIGMVDFMNF